MLIISGLRVTGQRHESRVSRLSLTGMMPSLYTFLKKICRRKVTFSVGVNACIETNRSSSIQRSDAVTLMWILSNNIVSLSFDFVIFEMGLRDFLKNRNNSWKYLAYSKHANGFLLSSLEIVLL